ncbi:MAG TPA: class I SAM-dependent methyltransferase [Gaiellaceae bacterium]|nr:class I SAM-dependent methyltransferase [Gaiellaceae bacterium]
MDDRVRAVLARLEAEEPRAPAIPVKYATGRFLYAIVAPHADCEILEVGGGRGLSTIWFAAAVRMLGGRVVSLERDPDVAADWRRNIADAGLEEWTELIEGDALETLAGIEDVFDVILIDAKKEEYERYFALARHLVDPGGLVIADNVLSHEEILAPYCRARQSDPTLLSVTVPLDTGLEVTSVLEP